MATPDIDLASAHGHHIAGTPDTYTHGWHKIDPAAEAAEIAKDATKAAKIRYASGLATKRKASHVAAGAFDDATGETIEYGDPFNHMGYAALASPEGSPERSWGLYQMGGYYHHINEYLRTGHSSQPTEQFGDPAKLAEGMRRAFDEWGIDTPRPITTYRGVSESGGFNYGDLKVGQVFTDKGVISTAPDKAEAGGFMSGPFGVTDWWITGIMLEIHVPKGVRVLGGSVDSNELMLAPGTRFRVVSRGSISVRTDPNTMDKTTFRKIVVEVLP